MTMSGAPVLLGCSEQPTGVDLQGLAGGVTAVGLDEGVVDAGGLLVLAAILLGPVVELPALSHPGAGNTFHDERREHRPERRDPVSGCITMQVPGA